MRKSIRELIKGKLVIGSGEWRIVYDLGNGYVLKVGKSKGGFESNQNEVKLYKSCPRPIRKHLGKIIDYGSTWLIMKKYEREVPKSEKYVHKLRNLESMFKKFGVIPTDTKRDNLRLGRNKEIIMIDYCGFIFHKK